MEEKGRRGGRLETEETEETEESVRALSLATRSRTPVPTQHGTASHNRWKGNGGERHTGRRGREEDERERKIDRRRERPPLDPRVCQLEHYYTPSAIQEEENIETTAFLLRFLVSRFITLIAFLLHLSLSRALSLLSTLHARS